MCSWLERPWRCRRRANTWHNQSGSAPPRMLHIMW
jgi:hypothetical protein